MIDLQAIDPMTLPSVALCDRKSLPAASGIYFAIANGKVQYIGRSQNINSRWNAHHRQTQVEPMSNPNIAYLLVSDSGLLHEIESALIRWLKPPLNTAHRPKYRPLAREGSELRLTFRRVWDEDLTNSEVSEATGIHMNTLTKYRKGNPQARLDILLKLRAFFEERLQRKVSLDEFIEEVTYQKSDRTSPYEKAE